MSLSKYKNLLYPANLWSSVFDKQISTEDVPRDWEKTIEAAFMLMNDHQMSAALLLYFREGLSWDEVARRLGVSENGVYRLAGRALRMLRGPHISSLMMNGIEYTGRDGKPLFSPPSEPPASPISMLNLRTRTYNCLRRAHISTVSQLLQHTEADLLRINYLGETCMKDIKMCLCAQGYSLPQSRPGRSC